MSSAVLVRLLRIAKPPARVLRALSSLYALQLSRLETMRRCLHPMQPRCSHNVLNLLQDVDEHAERSPTRRRSVVMQSLTRTMNSFDPARRCIVHDRINKVWVKWHSVDRELFNKYADKSEKGLIGWRSLLMDAWMDEPTKNNRSPIKKIEATQRKRMR